MVKYESVCLLIDDRQNTICYVIGQKISNESCSTWDLDVIRVNDTHVYDSTRIIDFESKHCVSAFMNRICGDLTPYKESTCI